MTLLTLTNYSTLIDAALEANYIEEKDVTLLQEWKKDPENWGQITVELKMVLVV